MKRCRWVGIVLVMPLAAVMLIAAGPPRSTSWRAGTQIIDNTAYFDANSLLMFVSNIGSFAYDKSALFGKNDGFYYPKGTSKTAIYAAGLWMGAKVGGGIRVSAAEYANDWVPGPMSNGTYQTDRGSFRVYKIKKGDTRENSADYSDWPFDDGAPAVKNAAGKDSIDAQGYRIPLLMGDQAIWTVYNDASPAGRKSDPGSGSAGPLGVEVHYYTWGYARSGALGQTIFMRFQVINKNGNRLDSAFVSIWADPDLGDASDDLVGCDTSLSLGYCYNSKDDQIYGHAVPAVGFDFFQGPIVPGDPDLDSAWVSSKGKFIKGYRGLGMSSFNKYINGTDPRNNSDSYNYMLGLNKDGTPVVDPITGRPTKFAMSGDPVAGTGFLDNNAADRRLMLSSGPFTMNPGDTQEVVVAVMIGQGTDRLSSVTELKRADAIAQSVFDVNFNIPGPPPQPEVWAVPFNGAVQLLWGPQADGNVQYGFGPINPETGARDTVQTFVMEGFNIYQGASSSGPWTKLVTYDVVDGIKKIYKDVDNPAGKERVVVQEGTDNGLKHELWVTTDRIRGGDLVNNRPYFFAVTAYNYDDQNQKPFGDEFGNTFGIVAESFENLPSAPREGVVPRSMTGVLYDSLNAGDTTKHVAGKSEGSVLVNFVNQDALTGHKYRVTFNSDLTWNLLDVDSGITLFHAQQSSISTEAKAGIVVRVVNPAPGVKDWAIPHGTRRFTFAGGAGDFGFEGFEGAIGWECPYHFFNDVPPCIAADKIRNVLLILAKVDANGNYDPNDPNVSYAYRYLRRADQPAAKPEFAPFIKNTSASYAFQEYAKSVPLSAWDVDSDPPRRLALGHLENNVAGGLVDGKYWPPDGNVANNTASSGPREWLWIFLDDYTETPKTAYEVVASDEPLPIMYFLTVARRGNVPFSPDSSGEDQFEILANHVVGPADVYEFTASKPGTVEGTVVANTVEKVHPVPNPYYNVTALEKDQFNRVIKFVNLPPAKTTIRIFNLAGDLIRTLVKDDAGSAELVWDVLTETGLPVASGLYLYHVEATGLGTKIGKLAVFTEVEQLNTY